MSSKSMVSLAGFAPRSSGILGARESGIARIREVSRLPHGARGPRLRATAWIESATQLASPAPSHFSSDVCRVAMPNPVRSHELSVCLYRVEALGFRALVRSLSSLGCFEFLFFQHGKKYRYENQDMNRRSDHSADYRSGDGPHHI
jgi:hypothetical protein